MLPALAAEGCSGRRGVCFALQSHQTFVKRWIMVRDCGLSPSAPMCGGVLCSPEFSNSRRFPPKKLGFADSPGRGTTQPCPNPSHLPWRDRWGHWGGDVIPGL